MNMNGDYMIHPEVGFRIQSPGFSPLETISTGVIYAKRQHGGVARHIAKLEGRL